MQLLVSHPQRYQWSRTERRFDQYMICDMSRHLELACGSGFPSFIDEISPPRVITTSDSSPATLLTEATCEEESGTSRLVHDTSFATSSVGATWSRSESASFCGTNTETQEIEWGTHSFHFIRIIWKSLFIDIYLDVCVGIQSLLSYP